MLFNDVAELIVLMTKNGATKDELSRIVQYSAVLIDYYKKYQAKEETYP